MVSVPALSVRNGALMDCKECKERFRADKIIEDWAAENSFGSGS